MANLLFINGLPRYSSNPYKTDNPFRQALIFLMKYLFKYCSVWPNKWWTAILFPVRMKFQTGPIPGSTLMSTSSGTWTEATCQGCLSRELKRKATLGHMIWGREVSGTCSGCLRMTRNRRWWRGTLFQCWVDNKKLYLFIIYSVV